MTGPSGGWWHGSLLLAAILQSFKEPSPWDTRYSCGISYTVLISWYPGTGIPWYCVSSHIRIRSCYLGEHNVGDACVAQALHHAHMLLGECNTTPTRFSAPLSAHRTGKHQWEMQYEYQLTAVLSVCKNPEVVGQFQRRTRSRPDVDGPVMLLLQVSSGTWLLGPRSGLSGKGQPLLGLHTLNTLCAVSSFEAPSTAARCTARGASHPRGP